jgi:hypothetical protein
MAILLLEIMFKLKINDIKAWPFEEYHKLNKTQLEALAQEHHISAYTQWMLPQMVAYFATWKLVYSNSKINPMATAKHNIQAPWEIGLWRVATQLKRGSLVKLQSRPECANYSALVPLILCAQKKYNGVPYSAWDLNSDSPVVDEQLLEAMLWRDDAVYGLAKSRVREIREQGLTIKSGPKMGQAQKPTSVWCLKGIKDTEYATVPALAATMLSQIWVAHPSLRSDYMVLDPYYWDLMPEPLVTQEIFKQPDPQSLHKRKAVDDGTTLPWEL